MSDLSAVKALVFDVFGTVVDWRTSLITDFTWWARAAASPPTGPRWSTAGAGLRGLDGRRAQEPAERGYVILDVLHRRSLEKLVEQFAIKGLTEADLAPYHHGLAPPASLARQRRGPDAAEDEIHHLAAVERQCRAAHQHGEVRRPAVGPHHVGRAVRALQARPRDLSRRGKTALPQAGAGDDGRRPQRRSRRPRRSTG